MGTEITGTPNPFLNTDNWQGVDDEPTAGSENLVKSDGMYNYAAGISDLDILAGLETKAGYYKWNGEFVSNSYFTAIDGLVRLERNSVYVYRGELFGDLVLSFYNERGLRTDSIASNLSNSRILRYEKYNNNHVIMIEFKTENEVSVLLSSRTSLFPFRLFRKCVYDKSIDYDNLSKMDFVNSSLANPYNNLSLRKNYGTNESPNYKVIASFLFDSAIPNIATLYGSSERRAIWECFKSKGFVLTKEQMVKGLFWHSVEVGETTYTGTNSQSSSMVIPMIEGERIYVRSKGNGVAPTVMFVNDSLTVLNILSTGLVDAYVTAPENTAFIIINCYNYNNVLIRYDVQPSYLTDITIRETIDLFNILDGLSTKVGYYNRWGSFVSNEGFTAIDGRVRLKKNTTYVYRGVLFSMLSIVFYDVEGNISYIQQANLTTSPYVLKYELNRAEDRVIMIEFYTGNSDLYALFSSQDDQTDYYNSGGKFIVYQKNVEPDDLEDDENIGLTLPNKLYAIKGFEKSLYLDTFINKNDAAPSYSVGIVSNFGNTDSFRFYFTSDTVGNKSIDINIWDSKNRNIEHKSQSFEIIDNTLSAQKILCCVGDSITEGQNMPYYIEQCIDNVLTQGSVRPTFVGTKGGTSGMASKPTKHEGWYGKNYRWLASGEGSPFINPNTNQLDIAYYRTTKLSLGASEYIDVVSLAMGFNGTGTKSDADQSFASMQSIIAAFKADNANTKFIVHLVTYPAKGNVLQPQGEDRVAKKASLLYFRNLCLNAYNNNQDANIVIGDLGLGYDRWFAYPKRTENPAPYYTGESVQVITDRVHPTADGAKQMGENIAAVILKMLQS